MWTLDSGLQIIRIIYPVAYKAGYNLSLAGGVMYRGSSKGDLDILAIRKPQNVKSDISSTLDTLNKIGYTIDKILDDIPYRMLYRLSIRSKKKIDLIVMDLMGIMPEQRHPFEFATSGGAEEQAVFRDWQKKKEEKLELEIIQSGEEALRDWKKEQNESTWGIFDDRYSIE